MSVALGFCAAFGSLMRPIFDGKFRELLATSLGLTVLQGVLACLIGIANSGALGMSNKKELSQQEKVAAIKAFDFKKGISEDFGCKREGFLMVCKRSLFLLAGEPNIRQQEILPPGSF